MATTFRIGMIRYTAHEQASTALVIISLFQCLTLCDKHNYVLKTWPDTGSNQDSKSKRGRAHNDPHISHVIRKLMRSVV